MNISFKLNGETVSVQADSDTCLIDLLRDDFGLTAAKKNCRQGYCGSCSVLMNGKIVPSCLVPVFSVKDQSVTTLEGFSKTWDYVDIERGFLRAGVRPCGYCVSGKIFAVHVLLEEHSDPGDVEIREALSGVLCRCTQYRALVNAVKLSAEIRRRRLNTR